MSLGGPLWAIVGPTAAGKSRMAVEVALEIGEVEILSCDSMGVYRRMDIAADKPTMAERRGVPHHLFDLADPNEDFTAVMYRDAARAAVDDVRSRGRMPLVVGGSGLWFRALVDDLEFAPSDASVRAKLEAVSVSKLWDELLRVDPNTTADPRNPRRVVRAMEIWELTGKPPSSLRSSWKRYESVYELRVCGLTWPRDELAERASTRVDVELANGLLAEAQSIGQYSRTASQALGVKEMLAHIRGELTKEEARELLIANTKRFIRRQLTWFSADPRVQWIDAGQLSWDVARSAIVRTLTLT